jgi:hypothetical protein
LGKACFNVQFQFFSRPHTAASISIEQNKRVSGLAMKRPEKFVRLPIYSWVTIWMSEQIKKLGFTDAEPGRLEYPAYRGLHVFISDKNYQVLGRCRWPHVSRELRPRIADSG